MPTYRKILKQAWKVTLQNKILWFLGFWVALMGNGGEYELFIKSLKQVSLDQISFNTLSGLFTTNFIIKGVFINFKNLFLVQSPLISFGFLVVLGGLIYLTITAQGALIDSIYHQVKKKHKVNLNKTWLKTKSKFWELLFTNLIFKGGGLIIAFSLAWPLVFLLRHISGLSITSSGLIVGIVFFAPMAILISFLVKYTLIYIIAKRKDPLSALISSLTLFKKNWLITIENALVLFLINLAVSIVTFVIVLILSFPIIATISLIIYPLALPVGYYYTVIAWMMIILGPIIGGILAAFQYSSWTILFIKLTGKRGMHSKIARLTADLLDKVS